MMNEFFSPTHVEKVFSQKKIEPCVPELSASDRAAYEWWQSFATNSGSKPSFIDAANEAISINGCKNVILYVKDHIANKDLKELQTNYRNCLVHNDFKKAALIYFFTIDRKSVYKPGDFEKVTQEIELIHTLSKQGRNQTLNNAAAKKSSEVPKTESGNRGKKPKKTEGSSQKPQNVDKKLRREIEGWLCSTAAQT
ncbi:MAG: hypothetical protein WDZ94_00325 [Patescibacteria group bacterium]